MERKNILLCYKSENSIALIGMQLVILFATPLTILPCKDTLEEIFGIRGRFTKKQNFIATLALVAACFCIANWVQNIGDAMQLLGATTNSAIGFVLPIIFYI
jgi:hypothetical protein